MKNSVWMVSALLILMAGCANEVPLGQYVAQMRAEQTYNPDAVVENLGYVPDGNGERMEKTFSTYTGKASEKLSGSSSRVLDGQ